MALRPAMRPKVTQLAYELPLPTYWAPTMPPVHSPAANRPGHRATSRCRVPERCVVDAQAVGGEAQRGRADLGGVERCRAATRFEDMRRRLAERVGPHRRPRTVGCTGAISARETWPRAAPINTAASSSRVSVRVDRGLERTIGSTTSDRSSAGSAAWSTEPGNRLLVAGHAGVGGRGRAWRRSNIGERPVAVLAHHEVHDPVRARSRRQKRRPSVSTSTNQPGR